MSIVEAKEKIEKLQQFIQYEPATFEQHVVKLYVIHENVTIMMGILNERG